MGKNVKDTATYVTGKVTENVQGARKHASKKAQEVQKGADGFISALKSVFD